MATHTTNYVDTFIAVAPDSTVTAATEPPAGDNPSVAARTWALIQAAPYTLTSDDVIFTVWADRRGVEADQRVAARAEFFSKGQACLRASDLGKRYGWGVHSDAQGRVALYGVGTPEYEAFAAGVSPLDGAPVQVKQAMRGSRAR
ncbi:MAG: DUF6157 family protein [Propionibacteriaceae bacterium]|jgi:hypothetical protein|nr:DUF6157 family protein [Propionibacteriaceae bacterium]